ncbi:MAG: LysR substrate-binding domain-containing protein [Burkholderiales bacterium]
MAQLDWYIRANLKPKHLQLLVALDDLRHLGRVANSLHVSQPAVSLALAELEKGLGMKLFERTPRGVVPNNYGDCLIRHARVVLATLAEARDELHALQTGVSGKIAVGALPAVTPGLIPQALLLLKRSTPHTRVVVHEGPMDTLLPELRRNSLDMVVGRLPNSDVSGDLSVETLDEGALVLVVARRHPLAAKRRIEWTDLSPYPWVLPPVGALQREPLENALQQNGCALPDNLIETLSVHVVTGYLQSSDAIGSLSRIAAHHYIKTGVLAQLPLVLPDPQRPIGMMWSRHKPASPAAQAFKECLRRAAQTTPA